jgi:Translocon-associated protein (TRAP), alpha subunit
MGRLLSLALSLLSLQATWTYAQAVRTSNAILSSLRSTNDDQDPVEEDIAEDKLQSPSIAVSVSASFPDAEIFGIKLVNGKPTKALLSFTNEEPEPVTVKFIGGALWTPPFDPSGNRIVRNLTATRYHVEVPAGEKQSLPYNFATELHPQDLRLELAAIISDIEGKDFAVQAFNETVSIVEPDTSIFDPQM